MASKRIKATRDQADADGPTLASVLQACERVQAAINEHGAVNLSVNALDMTLDIRALVYVLEARGLLSQAEWQLTRAQTRLAFLQGILTEIEAKAAEPSGPALALPPSARGKLAVVRQ